MSSWLSSHTHTLTITAPSGIYASPLKVYRFLFAIHHCRWHQKIPWAVTWGDQGKQLLKVTNVVLSAEAAARDHRERERNTQRKHGWNHAYICTCVLIQRQSTEQPLPSTWRKHSGKQHRKCSLSVQVLSVQQHFGSSNSGFQHIRCVTWEGELEYEEGDWCMELILRVSSKACSPLVRWRDALKCCRSLLRCGFTSAAESALSYAGLHMEEGSIWWVNGIPAQPLLSRCRAQSLGGLSVVEGRMPGRQHSPVCAPWARIHRSWLPSASSSIWPNVLSSFC